MFHGADPTGAQALAHRLLRISSAMNGIADRVLTAESLAEYPTGSVGMIDDASLVLRSTAGAIETAAHQIGTFRLPLDDQPIRRRRIRVASNQAAGEDELPSIGHWDPLGEFAAQLAPSDLAAVERDWFEQQMAAISAFKSPQEAGLSARFFPPGFDIWRVAQADLVDAAAAVAEYRAATEDAPSLFDDETFYALNKELHARLEFRQSLELQQALDNHSPEAGSIDISDAAIAAVLAGVLRNGSDILGRYFAERPLPTGDLGLTHVLGRDPDAAIAFFNALGAEGIVELAHHWAAEEAESPSEALRELSLILGTATHDDRLLFDGIELAEADDHRFRQASTGIVSEHFHIEELLLDGDFATTFVVDLAQSSFGRSDRYSELFRELVFDRRNTAMAVLLKHDATGAFVTQLDENSLAQAIAADYGAEAPALKGEGHIAEMFFASIAMDGAASRRVIDVLATMKGTLADTRVADGLSMVLIDHALDHFETDRASGFLSAFEVIAASGSGLAVVSTMMGRVTTEFVREERSDGWLESDGPEVGRFGEFVSQVWSVYEIANLNAAGEFVQSQAEIDRWAEYANWAATAMSAVSLAGGAVVGAAPLVIGGVAIGAAAFAVIGALALVVSLGLIAREWLAKDGDEWLRTVLADGWARTLAAPDWIERAGMIGLGSHPLLAAADIRDQRRWTVQFGRKVTKPFAELVRPDIEQHGTQSSVAPD